jgi:receptor expression-enhancing protein 5/6
MGGVDKEYVACMLVAVPILFILITCDFSVIIDIVAFVYPFYASVKAIESDGSDDDTQWLTYWLVFAAFKMVESIADFLVSFIPFYYLLKVAFLVWCQESNWRGATVVYNKVLKPFVVPLMGLEKPSSKAD